MTNKTYNAVYNISDIIDIYKGRKKSVSLCLLWDKNDLPNLIITECTNVITQENMKGVERDGYTKLSIH